MIINEVNGNKRKDEASSQDSAFTSRSNNASTIPATLSQFNGSNSLLIADLAKISGTSGSEEW